MVVEKKAKPDKPARPEALVVWEDKPEGPDDVGSSPQQHFAFDQRFAHQSELFVFEVAQAAVNELGRCRGRTARQIILLGQ